MSVPNHPCLGVSVFLQSIIYGNPDFYPPMIHSSEVIDKYGFQQLILSRRYRSAMIPAEAIDEYYPKSTKVLRLGKEGSSSLQSFINFALDVIKERRKDADIFLGYNMHGLFLAGLLSKFYRKPLVYHCHDYVDNRTSLGTSNKIFKFFERIFAPRADLIIVPDRARAQVMMEELNLPVFPLIVANCPIHSPDPQNTTLRDTLLQHSKRFERIVWRQGMINKTHGLEITIRSMPYWASPDWGFVLLGPGDHDYKETLFQLAREVGVSDRFIILPPLGDYREVAKFTVGADLGHALYEPFQINHKFITTASNKTMEYQAAGLPILLADNPSNRELIAEYQQGIVVDVSSSQAIAEGINQIFGNSELAQKMSEGSKRAFHERYNYELQYLPAIEQFKSLGGLSGCT